MIGGDNLPSPVGIGLTDLPNIWGPVAPLAPPVPASLYIVYCFAYLCDDGETQQKYRWDNLVSDQIIDF